MMDTLLQADQDLFLLLNGWGGHAWDGFWLLVTNKWSSIPLYLLLLILSYKQLGPRKTLLLLVTIVLLVTVTDQLANFFKYGVQRLRPCHEAHMAEKMRLVKAYCGGRYGFYSAHASNAAAIAIFFSLLLRSRKILGVALFVWVIFLAYSRIYIGVHYPLDVASGMAVGLFMGWLFYRLYIFAMFKYQL